MRAAVTFDTTGRAVEGPGAARLAERLGERSADPRGVPPIEGAG